MVEVANQIFIHNPTEEILEYCKKELEIPNPDYIKKQRMGFWTGNTPKTLILYEKNGLGVKIPYGCLKDITVMSFKKQILNRFPKSKDVEFGGEVPLYDYQEEAVTFMKDAFYGILQSAAGSGKTQIGLALASRLGKKTLWITHTSDLLKQSKDRAKKYFDESKFGEITEGRVNIGETITFATVQTLSNVDLPQYRFEWDTIIVDECHRVAGTPTAVTQFSKVLNNLAARHKYGLSATVHRADGMIKATYSLLGRVAYEVPQEAIADNIMKVSIQPCATGVSYHPDMLNTDGTINHAKMINCLCEMWNRNDIIVTDLCNNSEHSCLILSDRVSHLERLFNMLPIHLQLQASVIHGKMVSKSAKAERVQAIEDMRTGKKKFLFATYSLAKEGLDIPRLDRLFLVTPQKDYAIITQSIGRVDRVFPGKEQPVVYDYVDQMTNLIKSYKKRCTSYRKAGCNILEERDCL